MAQIVPSRRCVCCGRHTGEMAYERGQSPCNIMLPYTFTYFTFRNIGLQIVYNIATEDVRFSCSEFMHDHLDRSVEKYVQSEISHQKLSSIKQQQKYQYKTWNKYLKWIELPRQYQYISSMATTFSFSNAISLSNVDTSKLGCIKTRSTALTTRVRSRLLRRSLAPSRTNQFPGVGSLR